MGSSPNLEKINYRGHALVVAQLWWIWVYSDSLHILLDFLLSLVFLDMAPRGRKPHFPSVRSFHAANATMATAEFYEYFVPEEDKATMQSLGAKVCLTREAKGGVSGGD